LPPELDSADARIAADMRDLLGAFTIHMEDAYLGILRACGVGMPAMIMLTFLAQRESVG